MCIYIHTHTCMHIYICVYMCICAHPYVAELRYLLEVLCLYYPPVEHQSPSRCRHQQRLAGGTPAIIRIRVSGVTELELLELEYLRSGNGDHTVPIGK